MATFEEKLKQHADRLPEFPDTSDSPERAQVIWEAMAVAKGVELYRKDEREIADMPPGRQLLAQIIKALVPPIEGAQKEATLSKVGRSRAWRRLIGVDDPVTMAAITAMAVLRAVTEPPTKEDEDDGKFRNYFTPLSEDIALDIGAEIDRREQARIFAEALEAEGKTKTKIKKITGANPNKLLHRDVAALERRVASGAVAEWPPGDRLALGVKLLELLAETGLFRISHEAFSSKKSYTTTRAIWIHPDLAEQLNDLDFRAEAVTPRLLPMLCQPRPWHDEATRSDQRGGYITIERPLVRADHNRHSAALDEPMSRHDRVGLTILQNVAHRINRRIYEVMPQALKNGLAPFNKTRSPVPKLLPYLSKEEWESLSDIAQAARKKENFKIRTLRRKKRDAARKRQQKQDRLLYQLTMAGLLHKLPRFFFPWSIDWRGRAYPIPMLGPHPQSDDAGKALLEFEKGVVLGERGWYWLRIHCANSAGKDKLPHEERISWVEDRQGDILASAKDPLGCDWWTRQKREGKDCWTLLAACFELAAAWEHDDHPTQFESHLPIALDGSCNALQHLAALTRDEEVGLYVNLTATDKREDIYEEVSKDVAEPVAKDAATNEFAARWHQAFQDDPGMARDVMKNPVMTTGYGSTDRGVRDQIHDAIEDSETLSKMFEGCEWYAAKYLSDIVCKVREERLSKPMAAMEKITLKAGALAKAGKPFTWSTPNSSERVQSYHWVKERRHKSKLVGEVYYHERADRIEIRDQRDGAAPNYVHSMDSAHLLATVTGCHQHGIRDIVAAHDSISVHATNIDTLARVVREEFIDIYKHDWLALLGIDVEYGNLDISQVAKNPFFFN
jgi:DNA-directed RNA polymerase, mitochondrial